MKHIQTTRTSIIIMIPFATKVIFLQLGSAWLLFPLQRSYKGGDTRRNFAPDRKSIMTWACAIVYTRKNLTTCSKSAYKAQLTTCNILADFVRLVTSLIQETCYSHDITILLQSCFVNLVTCLLYRNSTGFVRTTL